ncbi:MAG: hypothetical protein HKN33_00765 [Pyrinomonadaceae bacterium]|nr:hypothetical protein [Pyrinomonadaceae bacterium]
MREKRLSVGSKLIRLLELTDKLDHPKWCLTGHTGFVLEGEFTLDLNETDHVLSKGDVFDVMENNKSHRHIPKVSPGGRVVLFLVEAGSGVRP